MIKKKLKMMRGTTSVKIPSHISEITLGQLLELEKKPGVNDLEAISILSGVPLAEIINVRDFGDLDIFGKAAAQLTEQLATLSAIAEIPKKVTFNLDGLSKTIHIPHNLAIEPAGAFFATREVIADELGEYFAKHCDQAGQPGFSPSLNACCQVLAHYFYCPVTGNLYDEYQADAFISEVKKMRVVEALPISRHFFRCYPNLSKPRTSYLSQFRQFWKERRESALLKSLNISIP